MAIKYPPNFDKNRIYPQQLDLDKIDVLVNTEINGKYISITNLPSPLSFGKHLFGIVNTNTPDEDGRTLKSQSKILFEFKDSVGNVIWSDLLGTLVDGTTAIGTVWVKEDPLRIYSNITDGQGTLTVVGELNNVPDQWVGKYNVRLSIPININKNSPNTSPTHFKDSSLVTASLSEFIDTNTLTSNYTGSYLKISASNLDTFGGVVDALEVSYYETGSQLTGSDGGYSYTLHDIINIPKTDGDQVYEDNISASNNSGLNPKSVTIITPMPTNIMKPTRLKFRFRYKNPNGMYAQNIFNSADGAITTDFAFMDVEGQNTIIAGNNNIITGSVFLGQAAGTGLELHGGSAYFRSLGYRGFISASSSPISGSGFMMWSGSALKDIAPKDYYAGVGLELVHHSGSYFRFTTTGSSGKPPGLDIRTDKFFVGSLKSAFISSSNNRIEISSSGFHLDGDGNAFFSGSLTSSAGRIGGFGIEPDRLQPQGNPAYFYFSASGDFSSGRTPDAGAVNDPWIITDIGQTRVTGPAGSGRADACYGFSIINAAAVDQDADVTGWGSDLQKGTATIIKVDKDDCMVNVYNLTASNAYVENDIIVDGNISASGNVYAKEFHTSYVSSSIIYGSGSTKFGDTLDDRHEITGSLYITGSIGPNVGIGTSTPSSTLTVGGSISASRQLYVQSHCRLATDSGAFVGLGTLNPTKTLQVEGDISSSGNVHLATDSGATVGIGTFNSTQALQVQGGISASGDLIVATSLVGSPKVGIGTKNPSKALTVTGDISASGYLHLQGNITASGGGLLMSGTGPLLFNNARTGLKGSLGTLLIDADNDLNLRPDSDLNIYQGTEKWATFDGDQRKFHFSGSLNVSESILAKTYRSENLAAYFNGAVDNEMYYFAIGGSNLGDVNDASLNPSLAFHHTAMCNTKITKLKIQFSVVINSLNNFYIQFRKWGGSGGFDGDGEWTDVGTAWTVKSADINDNERFYHAPSDWEVDAGEIWGLAFKADTSSGTPIVLFSGGITIEEDWNNQVSS